MTKPTDLVAFFANLSIGQDDDQTKWCQSQASSLSEPQKEQLKNQKTLTVSEAGTACKFFYHDPESGKTWKIRTTQKKIPIIKRMLRESNLL